MGLGERLKQIRTERGLRQEDIGQALRVGKSAVSQWESGIHEPSIATIHKIADLLNVTTDYLLGRTDHPQGREFGPGDRLESRAAPPGHPPPEKSPRDRLKGIRGALRADKRLTDEDVDEILEFIEWRKQRKREKEQK